MALTLLIQYLISILYNEGRLQISPGQEGTTIRLPFLFVHGELDIALPDAIIPSPTNKGVTIELIGTDDQTISHMDMTKGVGKKPVVVAGGRLNVSGMEDTCPSWFR